MKLKELLEELETLGKENDASVEQKDRKYLNITRDTGEFLSVLIKAGAVRQVLEIGTSNGYSTLWIASALPEDGHVTTLEVSPFKISQAKSNFKRANLDHKITVVQMGAVDYLGQASRLFDLVFLDADRASYVQVADQIVSLIRPGGILVCDNAVSHAEELREFIDFVDSAGGFTTTTVPVGKGEFVACKKNIIKTGGGNAWNRFLYNLVKHRRMRACVVRCGMLSDWNGDTDEIHRNVTHVCWRAGWESRGGRQVLYLAIRWFRDRRYSTLPGRRA